MLKQWLRTRINSAYTSPTAIKTDTGTITNALECYQALERHFDTDKWREEAKRKGNKVTRHKTCTQSRRTSKLNNPTPLHPPLAPSHHIPPHSATQRHTPPTTATHHLIPYHTHHIISHHATLTHPTRPHPAPQITTISLLFIDTDTICARRPQSKNKWNRVEGILASYQYMVARPGYVLVRRYSCWCRACHNVMLKGPSALRNIVSGRAGVVKVPGCERGDNPLYQFREQSCRMTAGAGVGANIQEIRDNVS